MYIHIYIYILGEVFCFSPKKNQRLRDIAQKRNKIYRHSVNTRQTWLNGACGGLGRKLEATACRKNQKEKNQKTTDGRSACVAQW
jgi:hypothetical protein